MDDDGHHHPLTAQAEKNYWNDINTSLYEYIYIKQKNTCKTQCILYFFPDFSDFLGFPEEFQLRRRPAGWPGAWLEAGWRLAGSAIAELEFFRET